MQKRELLVDRARTGGAITKGEFRKFHRGEGRRNDEGRREDLQIMVADMITFRTTDFLAFHEV